MQNCNASTRTLAEIPVSMRGELFLLSCRLCHMLCPLQSSAATPPSAMVPFNLWPIQHCYSHTVLQVTHMAWVQGTKRALLFLHCAGKCAYRPGGGPRRKDSGSGVLSRRAQGEAECHGRDAAAGISQPHVRLAVCLNKLHFALARAVHVKVLHPLMPLN